MKPDGPTKLFICDDEGGEIAYTRDGVVYAVSTGARIAKLRSGQIYAIDGQFLGTAPAIRKGSWHRGKTSFGLHEASERSLIKYFHRNPVSQLEFASRDASLQPDFEIATVVPDVSHCSLRFDRKRLITPRFLPRTKDKAD
jgi:hypothetical protein